MEDRNEKKNRKRKKKIADSPPPRESSPPPSLKPYTIPKAGSKGINHMSRIIYYYFIRVAFTIRYVTSSYNSYLQIGNFFFLEFIFTD